MGSSDKEQKQMRIQMLKRQSAWCVMLGIDYNSEEFENFKDMYYGVLSNNNPSEDYMNPAMKQIRIDIERTFQSYKLKFINSDKNSGKNKLYNLLKVYALILDPEIGYTRGMNFIAAMILIHIPNEVLACQIFMKVLLKDYWARMYINSTPKLFDITREIQERLKEEDIELYTYLSAKGILLEIAIAGRLMTLFTNVANFSQATHILNMFILDGERFLIDLIINIYTSMR